ncbi:MAG: F0F1 ATP synthase subunit delta [Thermodesulfobacteriota bacterium]
MLINWFVVAAQIVNFLILVLLLKRFLYGPIVQAMAAREERIASQLAAARQKREDAEQEEASLRQKIQEIGDQRQQMLAQAEGEAQAHKQKLLAQAREEVEQVRRKWAESVKWQKEAFLANLKQRLAQEFFAISRRALQELGNLEVEQRLLQVFLERLRQLSPGERQALQESLKDAGGELAVTTAFALTPETQEQIKAQVQDLFGPGLSLRFSTSSELLAGIELLTSSRKIAWSLGNYLDTLEEDLSQAFEDLDQSEAA